MIFAQEGHFLKAQSQFEDLLSMLRQATQQHQRIDLVERKVFSEFMSLGLSLLQGFVAGAGDGDVGETHSEGERTTRRLADKHTRRYVSIFGELKIERFVYGSREGQRIEVIPMDEHLGLPAGEFSYVLEDWLQSLSTKESFDEATSVFRRLLGFSPSVRSSEAMNRNMSKFAEEFHLNQPKIPPEEEGEILVMAADGKGVPMRRAPEQEKSPRRTKGQKANKKQMAYVGAVYSIDPFVRSADEVLDELSRTERAVLRPVPQHKRVLAEMTRVIEGERINGRLRLFDRLSDELSMRDPSSEKAVVCLMDGERALWEVKDATVTQAVGILDIFHVCEHLWDAAYCFHPEGSKEAQAFVAQRLRMLLEGKVGRMIGGLKQMLTKHALGGRKHKTVMGVIGYFENNRDRMHYDEYLACGYPIGSGVVEGACRHLVKDRLEQTGMRWSLEGAQAMLHLRAIHLNGNWNDFINYRIKVEQTELYGEVSQSEYRQAA